jgi:DNA-binding SARP family transcriptional activator
MNAPMSAPALRLLGEAACIDGAGQVVVLEPKDALLLAYLAVEGPTPRKTLAALLWPQAGEERASANLRQRLFRLRKLAGIDLRQGSTVASLPDDMRIDIAAPGAAAGELLATVGDDDAGALAAWLADARRRRRAMQVEGLGAEAERLEREGDLAAALAAASRLVDADPTSEHAHRRVMRLHYLRGDRSAALLAFDRCERVLKDEVGAQPSAETLALLRTLEAAEPGGALAVAGAVPASVLRPPRLVGRGAELAAALRAWQGERVFCLEGEAGMGKSRLLQEIAARQPETVAVQARPGDAVAPYATLVRLLRAVLARTPRAPDATVQRSLAPVLPEFGAAARVALATEAGQRLALGDAVAGLLQSAHGEGVSAVIVDDLHFADDASLEMLLHLTRGTSGPALRWGLARRPAEGSPALATLTDALLDEQRLEPVPLAPLTVEQLGDLLQSLGLPQWQGAEVAAVLHRHTGGNPMYALETLRQAWNEPGGARLPRPASVTRLIERRVMRLSAEAVKMARCAAVAGSDFTIELASAVLAVPVIDLADPWRELEDAHVFVDGAFAHDLIQESVQASLPHPIARHLHGEVARHLEQRAAAPASVAAHWLAADEAVRALPYLHRAGELAAAQRRFGEAAAAYEQEARLRLAQGDTAGAFAAALCMRHAAFELDLASRTDAALALLDQAAATPVQRAAACAERAIVCMHRGAMADAETAVEAGLAALGDLPEPGLRAHLRQHLAGVRLWQNRAGEAHELMRAIEHDVEATADTDRRIEYAQGYAVVLDHLNRPAESVQWQRRAADTALAAAKLPQAAQILLNLGLGLRDSGRLDAALSSLDEARAVLDSLPEGEMPYSSLDMNLGIVLRDLGRYGEALERLERAIERGRTHVPGWVPLFLGHRAQLWLALGQYARAQQDLDAAAVDDAPPLAHVRRELMRAQLLRGLGQDPAPAFERALAHLGPGARALSRHRLALARCTVLPPADALATAGEVLDAAMLTQRVGIVAAARTRLAQAALALGHAAEAARHARQLAALADHEGTDDLYRGEAWATAYRALVPTDPPLAAAVLERAHRWLRETAQRHVPEPFRDSFVHRNPVNVELLAAARRMTPV